MAIWKRIDEKKYSISGAEVPILDDPDHLAADPGEAADDSELDEAVDIEDADIDWGTADAELEAYLEQSGKSKSPLQILAHSTIQYNRLTKHLQMMIARYLVVHSVRRS